jgi:serine protease Do
MNRLALGLPALFAMVSCATAPLPAPSESSRPVAMKAEGTTPGETPAMRPSRKELVRRILPHNVRLSIVEDGQVRRSASGVVIGNEHTGQGLVSYVLTNAHAVDMAGLDQPRLRVFVDGRGESTEYAARVVATGSVPDMDLALVRVPGLGLEPAQLATDEELELGEDVVVAASPFGRALSLSGGMLSQVEWDKTSKLPNMVKTDAPIGYGASGGGIFSLESGKLLAIVEGYRTAKVGFAVAEQNFSFDVPMPGETFAAPTAKVRAFLGTHGFGRLLSAGPQTASR